MAGRGTHLNVGQWGEERGLMSGVLYLCDCAHGGEEAKERREATGTWLTPRHAREAAVFLMAERVGACQQQHAAESTMVSHHSTETEKLDIHTHIQRQACTLTDIQMSAHITYAAILSCQSTAEDLS